MLVSDDINDEPLFAKTNEELRQLDADALVVEFQKTTFITDTVRIECEAEMEFGCKCDWNIGRFKREFKK
jgi:hypothetical protein